MVIGLTDIQQTIELKDLTESVQIEQCVGFQNKTLGEVYYSFVPFDDASGVTEGASLLHKSTVMFPTGRTTVYVKSSIKDMKLVCFGVGL